MTRFNVISNDNNVIQQQNMPPYKICYISIFAFSICTIDIFYHPLPLSCLLFLLIARPSYTSILLLL